MLETRYPNAAVLLKDAESDVTAYATFPRGHWREIASTNPLERVHKDIKRRSNVIGIFPDDASVVRLVGAVLAEQHAEWQTTNRCYFSEGSMRQSTSHSPRRSPPKRHPNSPPPNVAGGR